MRIEIVIYHHSRGLFAHTQACRWQEREPFVFGCFSKRDAEHFHQVLFDILIPNKPAACTVADEYYMFTDRPAVDEREKSGDAVYLGRRHAKHIRRFFECFVRDPPSMLLYYFQNIDRQS